MAKSLASFLVFITLYLEIIFRVNIHLFLTVFVFMLKKEGVQEIVIRELPFPEQMASV